MCVCVWKYRVVEREMGVWLWRKDRFVCVCVCRVGVGVFGETGVCEFVWVYNDWGWCGLTDVGVVV